MVRAYVMIMTTTGSSPSVVSTLRDIEAVERADIVAGEFDIIVLIAGGSPQELLTVVTEEIHAIEGVAQTRTSIILET